MSKLSVEHTILMTVDEDHVVEAVMNDYEVHRVTRDIQMDAEMAAEMVRHTEDGDAGPDVDVSDNYLVVNIVGDEDVHDVKQAVAVAVVPAVIKMKNVVAREAVVKYVVVDKD